MRDRDGKYPPVEGVQPTLEEYQATYRGMNLLVPYNGKLTLARDMITERYVHMGIQGTDAFKIVLQFTLQGGKIVTFEDHSVEMKEMRKYFPKDPLNHLGFMSGFQESPLFKLSQAKKEMDPTG